jgi:hypothetical protein
MVHDVVGNLLLHSAAGNHPIAKKILISVRTIAVTNEPRPQPVICPEQA